VKRVERRSGASLAISIAVHLMLGVALGTVVWRYPLGQMDGRPPRVQPERLHYIALPSQPTESSAGPARPASGGGAPAALRAPREVPATIPEPAPADTGRAQAAGGSGDGRGAGSGGAATGVTPQQPDSRIALTTEPLVRVQRSVPETVDSIVSLAIGIYNDSMAVAAGRRKPGEWTVKGEDGKVWGWDAQGIRLGKFTIPNALLALLPLNTGSSRVSPIEGRSMAYIRRDIMENAQRSISEDEFRAAVKRIRERKERERRQNVVADIQPEGR
jgi:hypothetical protein